MMSYYHPAKDADMAALAEPLCLERGKDAARIHRGGGGSASRGVSSIAAA